MQKYKSSELSRARIFKAIHEAAPENQASKSDIATEALALLSLSEGARPELLSSDAAEAMIMRIQAGLVIGTTIEKIKTLDSLPTTVQSFLDKYALPPCIKIQELSDFQSLDWGVISTNSDVREDNSVGLCLAEYGVAETGSFVVHSSPEMPILINFLPLYLLAVVPKSKILHYMDDYALIANDIAKLAKTPRNMCLISGVSGTTDIEGVLVQGAHGPKILHIIVVEDI